MIRQPFTTAQGTAAAQAAGPDRPVHMFTAVKAFIAYRGKILLLREGTHYADGTQAGRYDVPGGRIEPGEAWDAALTREIQEECGLTVTIGRPFHVNEVRIDKPASQWQIVRIFFMCEAADNSVKLGDDHDSYVWADTGEILSHNLMPDLVDVAQIYLSLREHP